VPIFSISEKKEAQAVDLLAHRWVRFGCI